MPTNRMSTGGRQMAGYRRAVRAAAAANRPSNCSRDSSDDSQNRPGPSHQIIVPTASPPSTGNQRAASVKTPAVDKRPEVEDKLDKMKVRHKPGPPPSASHAPAVQSHLDFTTVSSVNAREPPGSSDQPITPKTSTGNKRAASLQTPVIYKRPRVEDNQDGKKIFLVVKNNEGKAEVLFEEGNGALSRKDIDLAYQEDPQAIFKALKDAFVKKN